MGLFIEHSCFLLRHSVLLRRVATRVRLTRPTVRYCFVHRFFCRPGQRSATGRKSVLFKQRVYVVLFVIEHRM
ncbi:hypothetical protein DN242_03225 [Salmonella enterica subsp. enterica serovar Reading]|nr:hypothetical protein [Salmonella enterica subsp. enterica serovar Reading]EBW4791340.1 hypothetical protein [Salmonella enterica subsp. enterica serovar Reading]